MEYVKSVIKMMELLKKMPWSLQIQVKESELLN